MKRMIIVDVIAVLFMILFLYTGISKLMGYTVFREQIGTSPLLAPFARHIAWWLPVTEFLVAFMLFVPRWRLKGLYASLALMMLFTGYIIAMLIFNEQMPCSCGGVLEQLSWKGHIVFNSVFIALAVFGVLIEKKLKERKGMEWAAMAKHA